MPSECGILISLMMTSYSAESSFLIAASPEVTVSTRCPSLRSVISSISQMERTSSQTRMLAMGHLRFRSIRGRGPATRPCVDGNRPWGLHGGFRDLQHKIRAVIWRRVHGDIRAMRLHDLIDDRQPK